MRHEDKGGGYWRPECAVTSVNLKVPFQVQQISSSCSSKFMLGNTFRSALDCFALVLYHTISNSGITKPASLMLVFMLGRQAWYKSEVFFFAFLFFFPSCDSVSLIYHLSCCVCT